MIKTLVFTYLIGCIISAYIDYILYKIIKHNDPSYIISKKKICISIIFYPIFWPILILKAIAENIAACFYDD